MSLSLIPLERGVLRLSGEDRVTFLQGLVSNDVEQVAPEHAVYATLLTPQGKFLYDFFLYARGDSLLLEMEGTPEARQDLIRRLRMYKLRSRVELTDETERWRVYAVIGESAPAAFDLPAEAGAAAEPEDWDGVVSVDPRLPALGLRLLVPAATPVEELERLATPAGREAYDRLRLSLGVPDGAMDMEREKSTLLEANIDHLNGISWEKGCYMGQELTARMRYRGLLKRRLVPVAIDGPAPEPGARLIQAGREVGELRSMTDGRALALLRLDALKKPEAITADDAKVTPLPAPWEAEAHAG